MINRLSGYLFPRAAADDVGISQLDDERHIPVMLSEVLAAAAIVPGEQVVDCTFGAGGYTKAFLEAGAQVIAFDRDPDAIAEGQALAAAHVPQLQLLHNSFSELEETIDGHVDVIVLDIGVSSMQIDRAERGFSFRFDGPLDMRMAQDGPSAADVIAMGEHGELAYIFKMLGEEKQAGRIASAIVREREIEPIVTTARLASIVEKACPRKHNDRIHPATRVFQALRIFVNDELGELAQVLFAAERCLRPNGRLVVVTFHSLEDRIVKRFFALRSATAQSTSRHMPLETSTQPVATFALMRSKIQNATEEEASINPRARSAKLRVGTRTMAAAQMPDMEALGFDRLPRLQNFMQRTRKG